jgi:hypothetical protein
MERTRQEVTHSFKCRLCNGYYFVIANIYTYVCNVCCLIIIRNFKLIANPLTTRTHMYTCAIGNLKKNLFLNTLRSAPNFLRQHFPTLCTACMQCIKNSKNVLKKLTQKRSWLNLALWCSKNIYYIFYFVNVTFWRSRCVLRMSPLNILQ